MKIIPVLTVAVALSIGATSAMAQSCRTVQRHKANRDALYGAVAGGLLGNAVSHGGGRTGGTLIGAGAGGLIGHQIGKNKVSCDRGYYYRHKHYYYRHGHRYVTYR